MRVALLLLTAAVLCSQPTFAQSATTLLQLAARQEAAGQLQQAADTYGKAAAAFHAAGNAAQEAAAYGKSAAANEKYADQLLNGTAAPAAPKTSPPKAAPPKAALPARTATTAPKAAAPAAPKAPALPPAPAGASPLAGKLVNGKPVGLFFMTRSLYMVGLRSFTYYFTPAGRVYCDPPGLTAPELAATKPENQGKYWVSGRKLSIQFTNDKEPETDDISRLDGGFGWAGGSIFSGHGPFASPRELVGSYEGGSSFASVMGTVLSSKSLTFNADGTYTGGGVVSATTVTERSVSDVGTSNQQRGRWSLSGWYLTLTDAQGHTLRDVAYPVTETNGHASLFQFNGTAYSRQ